MCVAESIWSQTVELEFYSGYAQFVQGRCIGLSYSNDVILSINLCVCNETCKINQKI